MTTARRNNVQQNSDPRAESVRFDSDSMIVRLRDRRFVRVPIATYRRLREATPEQLTHVHISPSGVSLRWPNLDEDLSVSGLVRDFEAQRDEYAV